MSLWHLKMHQRKTEVNYSDLDSGIQRDGLAL